MIPWWMQIHVSKMQWVGYAYERAIMGADFRYIRTLLGCTHARCHKPRKCAAWLQKEDQKKMSYVRSGIRTHAYRSRLRPERSALDRSAILTRTFLNLQTPLTEASTNPCNVACWVFQQNNKVTARKLAFVGIIPKLPQR